MVTFSELKVQEIVENPALSVEQKIAELRGYESEARGLQRASSESSMNADDGWEDDLRQVRLALDKLGAVEPLKGAASLYELPLDCRVFLDDESHHVEIETVKYPRVHRTLGVVTAWQPPNDTSAVAAAMKGNVLAPPNVDLCKAGKRHLIGPIIGP